MRVGQPEVERDDAGLDAEPEQKEKEKEDGKGSTKANGKGKRKDYNKKEENGKEYLDVFKHKNFKFVPLIGKEGW